MVSRVEWKTVVTFFILHIQLRQFYVQPLNHRTRHRPRKFSNSLLVLYIIVNV